MKSLTIAFSAEPKTDNSSAHGGDYRVRQVVLTDAEGQVWDREIADPDAGWSSLDHWIGDDLQIALTSLGVPASQVAEVGREMWSATSGAREIEIMVDVDDDQDSVA